MPFDPNDLYDTTTSGFDPADIVTPSSFDPYDIVEDIPSTSPYPQPSSAPSYSAPPSPSDVRTQAAQEAAFSSMAVETRGPRFAKYLKVYGPKRAGEYANLLDLLIDDYPLYADKIDSMINRGYDPNTIKKVIQSQERAEAQRNKSRAETEARKLVKTATSGITDPAQAEASVAATVNVERVKREIEEEKAKLVPDDEKIAELTDTARRMIQERTRAGQLPTDMLQLTYEEAVPRAEAAGRAIAETTIPTAAGAAGAFGTARAVAGKVSGPVAAIGSLAAGMASALVAGKAQGQIAKEVLGEEKYNQWVNQLAEDRAKYPGTVFAAEQIPGLAIGRINPQMHKQALDAARKVITGGAKSLTKQEVSAIGSTLFGGSVGATQELVRQINEGEIRGLELAAAFLLNSAVNASAFDGAGPVRPVTETVPGTVRTDVNLPESQLMDVKTGALSRGDLLSPQPKPQMVVQIRPQTATAETVNAQDTTPVGTEYVPTAQPEVTTSGTVLPRKFLTRSQKPANAPPEVLESLASVEPQTYEQHATGKALEDTRAWIDEGSDNVAAAERIVFSNDAPSAKKGVTAVALLEHYRKTGNVDAETKVTEHMDRQFRESGRFIQAASFWAKMSGGGMKKSFRNFLKDRGVTLTDARLAEIDAKFDAAAKMPNGEARNNAIADAVAFATQDVPVRFGDMLDAYRYSNMLSNPRSHERNIIGNAFNALVTRPISLISQGDVRGAGKYVKESLSSLPDAWQAAKDSWATTQSSKMIEGGILPGKSTFEQAMNEKTPAALKLIPKALYAQDQFFGKLIEAGETARLLKSGLSEEAAAKQAKELSNRYLYRENLGKDAMDKSLNLFSRALDGLGAGLEASAKYPVIGKAFRWFVPFLRTPINIAKLGVDASPLAYVGLRQAQSGQYSYPAMTMTKNDIAKAKYGKPFESLGADDQLSVKAELKERHGLAASGSMITLAGAALAAEGRTTWAAPQDPKEKELFYASGRKPYSVLIGDKWVPMMTFGPYALALAIPAAARDSYYDNPKLAGANQAEKMMDVAMGLARFYSSQTPVAGASTFYEALQGKGDMTALKAAGYIGTQFMPASGFVRYINQWTDPYFRKPKGFYETLIADIPMLNKDIATYTNPDGTPAQRTAMDVLPPYSIGNSNAGYEQAFQDRGVVLRSQNYNNRQVDGFAELIERGKIDAMELTEFLSTLPDEERTRITARLKDRYPNVYNALGLGPMPSMNVNTKVKMPGVPGI